MSGIPIIDISERGTGRGRRALAARFEDVARNLGFLYISGHGVPQGLIDGAFEATRRFHAMSEADKMALRQNKGHRGYQPPSSVKLIASAKFAPAVKPSLRSTFVVRHEVPAEDWERAGGWPLQGPNQWPADPFIKRAVTAYREAVSELGRSLLPVLSLALGQPEDFLFPFFDPPSVALLLSYYPADLGCGPDDFGSAPHTDYGFCTFLAQDAVGGLQVQLEDGRWSDAPPVAGTFVFNIGDVLARWTNDQFRSTRHRVINKDPTRDRYSVPVFFDPNLAARIECLDGFAADGSAAMFPPVSFGDYYASRLNPNYSDPALIQNLEDATP